MWVWTAAFAALVVLALAAYKLSRSRSFAGRHRRLADKVGRVKMGRNNAENFDLLKQLYAHLYTAIANKDAAGAYQTVDLAKAMFGLGVARPDEPRLMAAVAVRAIQTKQPDTAAAALDAFRLLLRRVPPADAPLAVEELTNIVAVAMRERHNFLAAKAAEIVFGLLERADREQDPVLAGAAIGVLRTIGVLTLRRRDADLFREIVTRLDAVSPTLPAADAAGHIITIAGAWLHRIVQSDDTAMFTLLAEFVDRQTETGHWAAGDMIALVREWQSLAGTASLRPHSLLAPSVAETTLRLALAQGDAKVWEAAVAGAGQTARMAIQRHGFKAGFALIAPLLEVGRGLLALELKFGSAENADSFRQHALYLVVRECLALAEFTARQDLVTTAGDIIGDLFRLWTEAGRANPKAVKRFCQLLAVYWLGAKSRQSKRSALSVEMTTPMLLSDADKQRLGFLL